MASRISAEDTQYGTNSVVDDAGHWGLLFAEGASASVFKPSWNATLTLVRPHPVWRADRSGYHPYRLPSSDGQNDGEFGRWLLRVRMFEGGVGDTSRFLVPVSSNTGAAQTFCRAVQRTANSSAAAAALLEKKDNRAAPLQGISDYVFMQCTVLVHKGKTVMAGLPASGRVAILALKAGTPVSAYAAVRKQLDALVAGGDARPPGDFSRYLYGDICAPNNPHAFIALGEAGKTTFPGQSVGINMSLNARHAEDDRRGQDQKGWEAKVLSHQQLGAQVSSDMWATPQVGDLSSVCTPWEDLLVTLSDVEQAVEIARAFSDCPDVVRYAFADKQDWLAAVDPILAARAPSAGTPQGAGVRTPGVTAPVAAAPDVVLGSGQVASPSLFGAGLAGQTQQPVQSAIPYGQPQTQQFGQPQTQQPVQSAIPYGQPQGQQPVQSAIPYGQPQTQQFAQPQTQQPVQSAIPYGQPQTQQFGQPQMQQPGQPAVPYGQPQMPQQPPLQPGNPWAGVPGGPAFSGAGQPQAAMSMEDAMRVVVQGS